MTALCSIIIKLYSCGNEFLRQFERLRMPKTIIKVPFNAIDIYKFEETENEHTIKGSYF